MQLVISNPVSTVSTSKNYGDLILSLLITICFCWRNVKKRIFLKEMEVNGMIILKRVVKFVWKEVKSIGLFQHGDSLCPL